MNDQHHRYANGPELQGIILGAREAAPTRASTLPETAHERKQYPVASGVLDYFPDAIVAIAHLSHVGNAQHNPGKALHWDRSKSTDEADTMLRHFLQRGTRDADGIRHSAKMAWRALALLQKEIEAERGQLGITDAAGQPVRAGGVREAIERHHREYERQVVQPTTEQTLFDAYLMKRQPF